MEKWLLIAIFFFVISSGCYTLKVDIISLTLVTIQLQQYLLLIAFQIRMSLSIKTKGSADRLSVGNDIVDTRRSLLQH